MSTSLGAVREALRWLTASGKPHHQFDLHRLVSRLDATIRSRPPAAEFAEALESAKLEFFQSFEPVFGTTVAQAITIKLINTCLARNHFQARDADLLSRPVALVFDPSNSCNLACPGCVHSTQAKEKKWFDWQPGILTPSRLTAFLDLYGPTALSTTLCNYGEPLVNPETPKFIRASKQLLMRTLLSTNLSLPRFDPEAYVESGLDEMVLSIDGASQGVYERFRRKGNFDLVLDNARKLVEAKRKSGRQTPVIAWRFLAFEHNVHEVDAARALARSIGLDKFVASPAWEVDWDDPDIKPAAIKPIDLELRFDVYAAMARNWNPFPDSLDAAAFDREFRAQYRPADTPSTAAKGSTCEWLYKNITMDAGGRIFPCCCSPRPGAELTFATFSPAAPGDPFNGEMYQKARSFFADPIAYRRDASSDERTADLRVVRDPSEARQPFCVKCPWDKTALPESVDMRNYFAALGPHVFDEPSLKLLSVW